MTALKILGFVFLNIVLVVLRQTQIDVRFVGLYYLGVNVLDIFLIWKMVFQDDNQLSYSNPLQTTNWRRK